MALTKRGGLSFQNWLCVLRLEANSFGARGKIKPREWRDVYDHNIDPARAIDADYQHAIRGTDWPWRKGKK